MSAERNAGTSTSPCPPATNLAKGRSVALPVFWESLRWSALTALAVTFLAFHASHAAAEVGSEVQYNRDIRPILVENCFACHGADSGSRKADLRLDRRDDAIEAGAIAPGDPDSSVVLDRIFSEDPEEVMPPPAMKKTLSPEQKELLTKWIKQGAEYEPHWSFIPPATREPPAVKDESWVRNPIDRFVLASLESKGLAPAPESDRRTLARYADTHGIHFDNYREMWTFRQWVIRAFHSNMSFDA